MPKALIFDSNVTLLFVAGVTKRECIGKHKRLQGYDDVDFDIICGIVNRSGGIVFTPHVLAEASNLLRYATNPMKTELAQTLKTIMGNTKECMVASRVAADRSEYLRLGLTDSVILEATSRDATRLTIDLDLYLAALGTKLDVINYNHVKDQRADFR